MHWGNCFIASARLLSESSKIIQANPEHSNNIGDITAGFWIRLGVSSGIFAATVFLVFPIIARWFFKTFEDNVSQYIFVLAMVFLGSFLAEAAALEAIIGASATTQTLTSPAPFVQ